MNLALATATLLIMVRSIYRLAELSGGFRSKLFTEDEPTFLTLEGGMSKSFLCEFLSASPTHSLKPH